MFTSIPRARRATTAMLLGLGLCLGLAILAAPSDAAAHGDHYDCRVHDFRPYPHRHVGPNAEVLSCNREANRGAIPVTAQCEALARHRGGTGPAVRGATTTATIPLNFGDNAAIRADALNAACVEALAACEQAALSRGARGAACQVIDRRFSY
ncbi:MAG: hypothetical protein AAGM38_13460 [Pseudomonadota bacterium]